MAFITNWTLMLMELSLTDQQYKSDFRFGGKNSTVQINKSLILHKMHEHK